MNKPEFLDLLDRFLEGHATEKEIRQLLHYYNSFQQTEVWDEAELGSSIDTESRMLQQLNDAVRKKQKSFVVPFYKHRWLKTAAAAVIILTIGGTAWWSMGKKDVYLAKKEIKKTNAGDFVPGGSKATLILADGTKIILDSLPDGVHSKYGNTSFKKTEGVLIFDLSGTAPSMASSSTSLNTISVPKGGQYELILPDKSKVWLNTSSTLRFPSAFTGRERKVEITGEAYFEVAKDRSKPFRVYMSSHAGKNNEGAMVEVLGTHFNINAYEEETTTKTTLLEGSVKITPSRNPTSKTSESKIISPGQQAILTSLRTDRECIVVQQANVEEVMAWKNSLFNFNTADIKTIMREIARWYNVTVIYEGIIPVRTFSGKIERHTPLSNVLKILEQSNIHFRIEDDRVIVTK